MKWIQSAGYLPEPLPAFSDGASPLDPLCHIDLALKTRSGLLVLLTVV